MVLSFAGCSGNWKDNAVAGWDNLANSLSKSQITKDDDLIGERTLSDDDDGVIRIGCNLIHDGVKEAKYSKAYQIHNGGKQDVIHCEQHEDLGKERERKSPRMTT